MKKTPFVLFTVSSFLLLSACGKMTQDPLSDKAAPVKDFTEKPTTPVGTTPVASDAVRIDTVDFYSFDEAVAGEFQIGARVLLPGYQPTVVIENLTEFSGATYDAQKGIFAWTPTDVLSNGDLRVDKTLQVKVIAQKANAPVLVATKEVHIQVTHKMRDPMILSIQGPSDGIREGSADYFVVQVKDEDAGADPSTFPAIVMQNINGYQSFASYMSLQQTYQMSSGVYEFRYYVDLSGAELVKATDYFKTNFQVISHFGKTSQKQEATLKIKNLLSLPKSTWKNTVEVNAGALLTYDFIVLDPKEEGYVNGVTFADLPPGATANCSQNSRVSFWNCRFSWKPDPKTVPGIFSFTAQVSLTNSDLYDNQVQTQTFTHSVRVLPKSTPVAAEGVR
jgi:hypothetical protein